MAGEDLTRRELRNPEEQSRIGRLSRREFMERAGLLASGAALASLAAACGAPQQTSPPAAGSGAAPASAPPASQAAPTTKPAPKKGGVLKVAVSGEPPGLDPVFTTVTQTSDITGHIFEGLLAAGARYEAKPMLAESYDVSKDGQSYTFVLRKGVTFHNGKEMTSADVVASLKRWLLVGSKGKTVAKQLDEVKAKDKYTVTMTFKAPTALLPTYMAVREQIIIPEELAEAAGKDALKQYIGTGPYKFVEHLPDRMVRLSRYDSYAALSEEPSGEAGRKIAYLDELRFIPVPEAAVRSDGLGTGEYDFADKLSPDSFAAMKANPKLAPLVVKPYQFRVVHMNKKKGIFTDIRMRRAIQKAIQVEPVAKAAYGNADFYRMDPSVAALETVWHSTAGKDLYNNPNQEQAKALLKEAGYNGEPIRWLATKEVPDLYDLALPIKSQLEQIGVKVDLQLMDLATLNTRRSNPDVYDAFITGHGMFSHPVLLNPLNATWPGWWENVEKDKLMDALGRETDEKKAQALVDELQGLIYKDAAFVKLCDYFPLQGARKDLIGFNAVPSLILWNCSLG